MQTETPAALLGSIVGSSLASALAHARTVRTCPPKRSRQLPVPSNRAPLPTHVQIRPAPDAQAVNSNQVLQTVQFLPQSESGLCSPPNQVHTAAGSSSSLLRALYTHKGQIRSLPLQSRRPAPQR